MTHIPGRILTLATLRKKGACASQRRLFKRRFGDRVRVTEAGCESVAIEFSFSWAASHLLSPQAYLHCGRDSGPIRADYASGRISWDESRRALARAFARAYIADGKWRKK